MPAVPDPGVVMNSTDIFEHCFDHLTEEDIATLKEFCRGYDYQGATYTFLSNYIWRKDYDLCWEVIGDYLCMASLDQAHEEPTAIIAIPLTKNGTYEAAGLRATVLEAKRRFDAHGIPFEITSIPGHMVHLLEEAFPEEMVFEHERDEDEYVYEKEKLINLSGRALHKKKNHLNYFLKNYEYEVRPVTKELLPKLFALSDAVEGDHERTEEQKNSMEAEKRAIAEFAEHLDDPDVYSAAIFMDGHLRAFAMGERLSDDTAVEHFEKADINYRGLYQVICREFCRSLPEEIVYVNREEDMGLENLRHAKEALKPHHMAEKYTGTFR